MKNLLIVAICCVVASCSKSDNSMSNASTKVYGAIPNWKTDTLFTAYGDDSMYAFTQNGKSYIRYQNNQYELKAYDYNQSVSDKDGFYRCDVLTMQGTKVNPDNSPAAVFSSRYWDKGFQVWKTWPQRFKGNFSPFKQGAGEYQGQ